MAKKEGKTYEELMRDIKAKNFAPVYMLMGEEPYFIDTLTDALIENVLTEEQRDFNQVILYGSDADAVAIVNAARRFPMKADHQLVVVKEAQQIRNLDLLTNYVKSPLKSTVLVLNHKYKVLDRRKTFTLELEKNGILFDSQKVKDYRMPAYITTQFKLQNIGIDEKSAQMLADYLGNDLSHLHKEIEKLQILLANEPVKRVTPELIEQNVGISKEYNIFEFIKALSVKDILKANQIVQYFDNNQKSNPIQTILPMLFNYFSNLLICFYSKNRSEQALMEALGLRNSFQLKDYLAGLRSYSAMQVFRIISYIRTADAKSKGIGSTSSDGILKELTYRILH